MHCSRQTAMHQAPRAPHGHRHRTSHGIHESARTPSEAASSQPTHHTPARRSSAQARNTSQQTPSPHFHGQPPRTHPPRLALGAKTRPRSLTRRGHENYFDEHRTPPRKTQTHPRFALPLALSLSRRCHPHRKARQGSGPRHEEADSHGKGHRLEVAPGDTRVPEAQEHRGPGGGLGARPGRHSLHRHGRGSARLRGRHHQVRGL